MFATFGLADLLRRPSRHTNGMNDEIGILAVLEK
jgi:hypothetical protein